MLDYQCNKYYIKNAYELEQKYQAYIEMKEEQKKILEVTNNLTNAETDLMNILGRLGVIDTHIWIAQVKAILNPKEMVEVRHNLSIRRQKLRNQIEYNENRIEDAKNNIKNITKKNPQYSKVKRDYTVYRAGQDIRHKIVLAKTISCVTIKSGFL